MPDLKERYSCSGPEAIERICGPSCLMPRRGGEGRASFNLGSITGEFKIQGCNNHLGGSNKKTWCFCDFRFESCGSLYDSH